MLKELRSRSYSARLSKSDPVPLLWSKEIARYCDFRGSETYWLAKTETCQSEDFFRRHYGAAHGLVWVRLSTRSRRGARCDLDNFVSAALPTINRPFALITTDGDVSVPRELAKNTVEALLACRSLVSWSSQNFVGSADGRLVGIPIGIDLHTPGRGTSPQELIALLADIRGQRAPLEQSPLKVLCDFKVSLNSTERRHAVEALEGCSHVDFLSRRIAQAAIWRRYAQYPFVLSTMGNGLDCHRTWELLYLGCIVITKTSPLDHLYDGLPVVIVEDWSQVRDYDNLQTWLRQHSGSTRRDHIWKRLEPATLAASIRETLK